MVWLALLFEAGMSVENDRILFRFFEWKLMTCLKLLSAINSKKRVLNLDKYKCKDQDRCLPISIWEVE